MTRPLWLAAVLLVLPSVAAAAAPPAAKSSAPVSLDDRLVVELVAQEPQIVTPTGVACDVRGNVWVIESNTHFPPKDYKGHPTDRIWVFSGFENQPVGDAASGKASTTQPIAGVKQTLFADGFQQAMSLTITPGGKVYVVCRNEVVLLEDEDHDLKPDTLLPVAFGNRDDRKTLVRLDTKATYPHNGLNGAALSPDGEFLYFCLGLNTGFDYAVVGSDNSKVTGGGEGGSVWRCTPDGRKVERIATGFWNCHDLTFDAFGRLFAVDNDPDDIGPCRLLDIIDGGDYGWKFKNGRKGVHPFTAWNGELPGTLPMVAGTGEAPSGVLAYESDNLPADYRGQLLVTSWGDHVVQRFTLKEKGASFESTPAEMLRGGEDFRPVGIAQASDGSVFISDWVDKSYTLHGKGKLWRVRAKPMLQQSTREPRGSAPGPKADDVGKLPVEEQVKLLSHAKRELRTAAGESLARLGKQDLLARVFDDRDRKASDRTRIAALWAIPKSSRERERLSQDLFDERTPAVTAEVWRTLVRGGDKRARSTLTPFEHAYPPVMFREMALAQVIPDGFPVTWMIGDKPTWLGDPFCTSALATNLARHDLMKDELIFADTRSNAVIRALALRRSSKTDPKAALPDLLRDKRPEVRRVALQWVGEDRLVQFKDNLADALKAGDVSRDLLATYLACREKLDAPLPEPGKPPAERSGHQFAADFLFDEKNDLALRRVALDLVNPADPKLPAEKLIALVDPMGVEAVKALAWRDDEESQAALRAIAADEKRDAAIRREAVVGLARSAAASAETRATLAGLRSAIFSDDGLDSLRSARGTLSADEIADLGKRLRANAMAGNMTKEAATELGEQVWLATQSNPATMAEADRLFVASFADHRPKDTAAWQKAAADGGDVENGRRLFSLATGGRCYVCHAVNGRGGAVGPDLSGVGRAMDRAKLVESIVEPSKEIAPLFVGVTVELKDGTLISGVGMPEAGANFVSVADATGKRHRIKAEDVESRRTDKLSVMPEGLATTMTTKEFRDLVAYLATLK